MRIQLATCHCDYDLRFHKKYNFLTDFIGPQRSYLLDDVVAWKRRIRHVLGFATDSERCEITSDHFHVIRQRLVDERLPNFCAVQGNVFLIDECCSFLQNPLIVEQIIKSENIFVFLQDEPIDWLPAKDVSVSRFECAGCKFVNVYDTDVDDLKVFIESVPEERAGFIKNPRKFFLGVTLIPDKITKEILENVAGCTLVDELTVRTSDGKLKSVGELNYDTKILLINHYYPDFIVNCSGLKKEYQKFLKEGMVFFDSADDFVGRVPSE